MPSGFGPKREKRDAPVKAHIPRSLREHLEQLRAQRGPIVSMSDYLHEVIEEHVAIRLAKQQIGRRVGNS